MAGLTRAVSRGKVEVGMISLFESGNGYWVATCNGDERSKWKQNDEKWIAKFDNPRVS